MLGQDPLFAGCRLSAHERSDLLDIFLATCEWTRLYFGWRPNLPDEADNHLVELAVAGRAEFVVTRTLRDLTRVELVVSRPALRQPGRLSATRITAMSALTVRLPDDKHQRLRALADSRGTTLNRLIDDMVTLMPAEFDAETRFKLRAARRAGQAERGLALLDKAAGQDD